MGLCSCTAKFLTFLFALLIFCVGIILLGVGIFAVTRLRQYIPVGPTPWVLIGLGVVVLILGTAGFTALCCPSKRKRSLCVMILLTTLAFAMSGAATGLGFYYEEIMTTAFKNGFGDEADGAKKKLDSIEQTFYHGMRDVFQDLYADCKPTSYLTDEVHTECEDIEANPNATVTADTCAGDDYPTAPVRVGLYCKEGPGLDDFTIDVAMSFPNPDESLKIKDFVETRSFGYFANYVCMPTKARYDKLYGEVLAIQGGRSSNTTFGGCYASTWWSDTPPPIAKGAPFTQQPDGDPLTWGQKHFFDNLAPDAQEMSDKLVFCFCSDKGTDSTLYGFLKTASAYSKWISLGATIFFMFVFVAECYLCCCYRDKSDTIQGKQLTVLRP